MSSEAPLKPRFDFTKVFSNTKDYIDRFNTSSQQRRSKLNANHRATAELIIRLYLKQLHMATNFDLLEAGRLPGFITFNGSLAKCKGCTERTIINHRERLVKAGFIIKEERRGASGVEIWVDPVVLNITPSFVTYVDKEEPSDVSSSFFSPNVKNFHPLVHEQQEQLNINSTVDNSTAGSQESKALGSNETGGVQQEHHKNTEENVVPVSKRQICSEKNQEQVSAEAGRIFLLSLVRQFWEYAKIMLYPAIVLSDPEEREVLNLIWASVYGKFRVKDTDEAWLAYHQTAITRIEMVRRWLDRSPGHWIPKPHLYFHVHNDRNGFKNTWNWYVRQETLKIEVRNQLELQKVKLELDQHQRGQGKFRHKTRLQLFRIHEKRLSRYKDEALMQAYQQSLQRRLHLKKIKGHAV